MDHVGVAARIDRPRAEHRVPLRQQRDRAGPRRRRSRRFDRAEA
jgi:hypothetical protein